MTKIIKKDKCRYEAGFIVKGNKIVNLPLPVAIQLKRLEAMAQRAMYLAKQEPYHPAPSLDGFEQKSERPTRPFEFTVDTPVLDAKIEESLKITDEIKNMQDTAELAEFCGQFNDLVEFCVADKFVEGTIEMRLDLPTVGDPLKLTDEKVFEMLKFISNKDLIIEIEGGDTDGDCECGEV